MPSTAEHADKPSLWFRLVARYRIPISALFALPALLFIQPTRTSLLAGLPWIVIGEAFRIWASGHIHKRAEVTQTGPYALCRHPLYLGHAIITAGFVVASAQPWLILVAIPLFLLIFLPTMDKEEGWLTRDFGDEYRAYAERVPRFFPRWHAEALRGNFDWQLVRRHREWNNVLGLVALTAIFVVVSLWRGTW